jgi:hypothetical protein
MGDRTPEAAELIRGLVLDLLFDCARSHLRVGHDVEGNLEATHEVGPVVGSLGRSVARSAGGRSAVARERHSAAVLKLDGPVDATRRKLREAAKLPQVCPLGGQKLQALHQLPVDGPPNVGDYRGVH